MDAPNLKTEDRDELGSFDAGNRAQSQETSTSSTSNTTSNKRQPKGTGKTKATATVSGQRFQCPKCPKNFSRVENLTRHQANHEEVGKFACVICRKRFTRSDLLNRHRRIHTNQSETSNAQHVTQLDYNSASPPQPGQKSFQSSSYQDAGRPLSNDKTGGLANYVPNDTYCQHQHQGLYQDNSSTQPGYQNLLPQDELPAPRSSMILGHADQSQGLTSLMEAALAPPDAYAFTPAENFNPSLWGGFMLFGDNTNAYMGTYDADISWTLSSFHSESSPGYGLDQDMLPMDDFAENPYQYQAVPYRPDDVSNLDAADAEDEDTNDWPDKVDRPEVQTRAPRIVPLHLLPVSWQTVLDEARNSGLSATTIRPFQQISATLRSQLLSVLDGSSHKSELSRPEISDAIFPPVDVLDFFLRLYIRYVHPRFSVLHLPTFDIYNSPPLLLVAMMFLGSSHSSSDRGRFSRLFYDHLRVACLRMQEVEPKCLRITDNILTYFLLCLAGTWSGSKQAYEFAEGGRGTLITALRRSRILDCRPSARIEVARYQSSNMSQLHAIWLAWAETEKRKRLGLSIYIFDCQYPALFNCQPYVSKAETTNCVFPCPEEYWEANSAEQWKMLVGAAEGPPATYYLHALNACLLRKWVKPPPPITKTGGEFGKIVLIYAIHTHIFEWRQSTSMLNPTGLMGTFGNTALPIGEGLKERRRWLVDGLDSWGECYQSRGTSIAASLLHRLAYIALDVSLSDMHLVAGRSNNMNDGNFAEENLKHWANSEIANSTMSHVYSMLELCHHSINHGVVANSSYEVAVCLFTGGIICWAYAKLKVGVNREGYREQVHKASVALSTMGCWRMCSMFGRILNSFEVGKNM
ncbi:fungal-specific transcription factor domain-containing protein [Tricladium varicosporioides]|nr:fungal-specific transcription factor domain-containing protein [Hymenoscyphus varicosporioides]